MAKSNGAGMPESPERSLLSLLRESGDALEAASPPFNAPAAASRLGEAARAQGLLPPGGIPEGDLAATGAELEEEAPPFDVETGAARLREAARAHGLLASGSSEDSAAQANQVSEVPAPGEAELDQTILRARAEHEVRAATNAQTSSPGAAQEEMASSETRGQLSIGEVLAQLRPEFPDISVSKIRFLEAEGLIQPTRSRSGHRRFCVADIERLRHILIMQRDSYLPLRVIREQLAYLEDLRAGADAGDQAAAGQLANLLEGLQDRADHRLGCQPHLLALRMLARSEAATGLPRQVVTEIIRATKAVLAEVEAVARAVGNTAGDELGDLQGTFLRVRLSRLAAAADDAITAATVGDSAEMRRHLRRFETLTEAIWAVLDAAYGPARPHPAASRPTTGADDPEGLRPWADVGDQAAAGWPG